MNDATMHASFQDPCGTQLPPRDSAATLIAADHHCFVVSAHELPPLGFLDPALPAGYRTRVLLRDAVRPKRPAAQS